MVSTTTIQSEGYDPHDWIKTIDRFVNKPELTSHLQTSIEDYVHDEENQTGGNIEVDWMDGIGLIYLTYSPYLRSKHGIMLRGDLYINKDWEIYPVDEVDKSFLQASVKDFLEVKDDQYLTPVEDPLDTNYIARFEITEDTLPADAQKAENRVYNLFTHVTSDLEDLYHGRVEEQEEPEEETSTTDLIE